MKANNNRLDTTIVADKTIVCMLKELKEYSSEPIQGVILRLIREHQSNNGKD